MLWAAPPIASKQFTINIRPQSNVALHWKVTYYYVIPESYNREDIPSLAQAKIKCSRLECLKEIQSQFDQDRSIHDLNFMDSTSKFYHKPFGLLGSESIICTYLVNFSYTYTWRELMLLDSDELNPNSTSATGSGDMPKSCLVYNTQKNQRIDKHHLSLSLQQEEWKIGCKILKRAKEYPMNPRQVDNEQINKRLLRDFRTKFCLVVISIFSSRHAITILLLKYSILCSPPRLPRQDSCIYLRNCSVLLRDDKLDPLEGFNSRGDINVGTGYI